MEFSSFKSSQLLLDHDDSGSHPGTLSPTLPTTIASKITHGKIKQSKTTDIIDPISDIQFVLYKLKTEIQ